MSYGLYRSITNGKDWDKIANDLPTERGNNIPATDIVIDPANPNISYAAFWGHGVYKVTNANAGVPSWR